jgi:O-antigen/teichoic acid export membrane protein
MFLLAAQVVYALFNVGAMVLLGNALAAKGYGEYAFYYALIPLIGSVCDAGIGIIVVRGIARDHSSGPRLIGDALLIKAAIAGLVLLVGVGTAWVTLDPTRATVITLVAVGALIAHGQDPAIWVFRAREKLHLEALMLLLSQIVWLPLLVVAVRSKASLPWLLAPLVLASAVRFATGAWIASKRLHRPEFRVDTASQRALLAEGLPFGAAMFGTVLYGQVGLLMLKAFATASDVAYFNVSFMLSQPLTIIAMVFGIAIFPMIARDSRGGGPALRRDLTLNFKWQVLFSVPLMVGLFLLARPVVSLLFRGRDFQPAARGLAVTSLGLVVFFLNISYRYVLAALDRQRQYFHAVLVGLAANVVLCAALIPRLGYLGACVAYLGGEASIQMMCHHALSKHVRLSELLKQVVKPLAAGAGMGLLVFAFRGANTFVRVAIGCVAYPGLLLLLRAFTAEEMRVFRRLYASFGLPGAALLMRLEPSGLGGELEP